MKYINQIKELCGKLDANIYWKDCNFVDETEDGIQFYSRDYCKNITFEELIRWYIERIDYTQADEDEVEKRSEYIQYNIDNLMELIKIYSMCSIISKLETLEDTFVKLREIIN